MQKNTFANFIAEDKTASKIKQSLEVLKYTAPCTYTANIPRDILDTYFDKNIVD